MLQSQSGNEFHNRSFSYQMADASQVGEARRFASVLCGQMDFDETHKGRAGIVVNELGNNLVRYAKSGQLIFRCLEQGGLRGLEILSVDSGPGLNVDIVMKDGFTTGKTPGTGLGAVRRLADAFDIYSLFEGGTIVFAAIMSHSGKAKNPIFRYELGAINTPVAGENLCGDGWSVRQDGENIDIIVVDGLGHGPQANFAAVEALAVFETTDLGKLDIALSAMHARLRPTRGAAVFLLAVKGDEITFTGAGNIRALIQTPELTRTLISQNGTAGLQIRTIKVLNQDWNGQGYLILHSDGITSRWDLKKYPGIFTKHPAVLAAVIARDHMRGNDDTTVVVVRKCDD